VGVEEEVEAGEKGLGEGVEGEERVTAVVVVVAGDVVDEAELEDDVGGQVGELGGVGERFFAIEINVFISFCKLMGDLWAQLFAITNRQFYDEF